MQENVKKLNFLGLLVPLLAIIIAFSPLSSRDSLASSTWTGTTTYAANVRTGPSTGFSIVTVYAPGTTVTVYATVTGQVVWGGISNWYRISSLSSSPRFIYGGLVSATTSTNGGGGAPSPTAAGKEIVVSISREWMWAYENGVEVYNSAVMTARPSLSTPTGTYHIFLKLHPTTFTSPWPYGSSYWYPPTFINYALEWKAGGFFLHDSWWHSVYGPGTNGWHYDPKFGWQWGTHGCIAMPLSAAAWLYNWAPIGTLVQVNP